MRDSKFKKGIAKLRCPNRHLKKRSFIVSRNEFTQAFPNFTTSGYGMTPEIAITLQTVLRRCSGTTH